MKNCDMKNLLIVLLLMAGKCYAQPAFWGSGDTKQYIFHKTFAGAAKDGLIYLPKEWFTTAKKLPVLFFHNGTMLPSNLAGLEGQPLPSMIHAGMRLDSIKNPKDGQPYSFIVVSMTDNNYPFLPGLLRWLQDTLRGRIDASRVYITGLSQGGLANLLELIGPDSCARLITAAVPMSTPNIGTFGYAWSNFKTYNIHSWWMGGNSDAYTLPGSKVYNDSVNRQMPGNSIFLEYIGGHGGWNTLYDVNWRDNVTGTAYTTQTGLSIYQWLLQFQKGTAALTPLAVKLIKQKLYKQ